MPACVMICIALLLLWPVPSTSFRPFFEPSLDKLDFLGMHSLNLGRFAIMIQETVLVPVMHRSLQISIHVSTVIANDLARAP